MTALHQVLPKECTDGSVRDFGLSEGDRLELEASGCTAIKAGDGTAVGRIVGDCIRLDR